MYKGTIKYKDVKLLDSAWFVRDGNIYALVLCEIHGELKAFFGRGHAKNEVNDCYNIINWGIPFNVEDAMFMFEGTINCTQYVQKCDIAKSIARILKDQESSIVYPAVNLPVDLMKRKKEGENVALL